MRKNGFNTAAEVSVKNTETTQEARQPEPSGFNSNCSSLGPAFNQPLLLESNSFQSVLALSERQGEEKKPIQKDYLEQIKAFFFLRSSINGRTFLPQTFSR